MFQLNDDEFDIDEDFLKGAFASQIFHNADSSSSGKRSTTLDENGVCVQAKRQREEICGVPVASQAAEPIESANLSEELVFSGICDDEWDIDDIFVADNKQDGGFSPDINLLKKKVDTNGRAQEKNIELKNCENLVLGASHGFTAKKWTPVRQSAENSKDSCVLSPKIESSLNAWCEHSVATPVRPSTSVQNMVEGRKELENMPVRVQDRSVSSSASKVRQRKFPGPAGLLPSIGSNYNFALAPKLSDLGEIEPARTPLLNSQVPLCSQDTNAVFQEGPWCSMKADFETNDPDCILDHFNVGALKKKAAVRKLLAQKVPFLALLIKSIDLNSPDPCAIFRDPTGEIHGTLHQEVWECYGGQLQAGAVVVLRNVGVLSTGLSSRRHYLNITNNNITNIYSPLEDNRVRRTTIHSITKEEILKAIQEAETLQTSFVNSPEQIFNSSNNSFSPRTPAPSLFTNNFQRKPAILSHGKQPHSKSPLVPNSHLPSSSSSIRNVQRTCVKAINSGFIPKPSTSSSLNQLTSTPSSVSSGVSQKQGLFQPKKKAEASMTGVVIGTPACRESANVPHTPTSRVPVQSKSTSSVTSTFMPPTLLITAHRKSQGKNKENVMSARVEATSSVSLLRSTHTAEIVNNNINSSSVDSSNVIKEEKVDVFSSLLEDIDTESLFEDF